MPKLKKTLPKSMTSLKRLNSGVAKLFEDDGKLHWASVDLPDRLFDIALTWNTSNALGMKDLSALKSNLPKLNVRFTQQDIPEEIKSSPSSAEEKKGETKLDESQIQDYIARTIYSEIQFNYIYENSNVFLQNLLKAHSETIKEKISSLPQKTIIQQCALLSTGVTISNVAASNPGVYKNFTQTDSYKEPISKDKIADAMMMLGIIKTKEDPLVSQHFADLNFLYLIKSEKISEPRTQAEIDQIKNNLSSSDSVESYLSQFEAKGRPIPSSPVGGWMGGPEVKLTTSKSQQPSEPIATPATPHEASADALFTQAEQKSKQQSEPIATPHEAPANEASVDDLLAEAEKGKLHKNKDDVPSQPSEPVLPSAEQKAPQAEPETPDTDSPSTPVSPRGPAATEIASDLEGGLEFKSPPQPESTAASTVLPGVAIPTPPEPPAEEVVPARPEAAVIVPEAAEPASSDFNIDVSDETQSFDIPVSIADQTTDIPAAVISAQPESPARPEPIVVPEEAAAPSSPSHRGSIIRRGSLTNHEAKVVSVEPLTPEHSESSSEIQEVSKPEEFTIETEVHTGPVEGDTPPLFVNPEKPIIVNVEPLTPDPRAAAPSAEPARGPVKFHPRFVEPDAKQPLPAAVTAIPVQPVTAVFHARPAAVAAPAMPENPIPAVPTIIDSLLTQIQTIQAELDGMGAEWSGKSKTYEVDLSNIALQIPKGDPRTKEVLDAIDVARDKIVNLQNPIATQLAALAQEASELKAEAAIGPMLEDSKESKDESVIAAHRKIIANAFEAQLLATQLSRPDEVKDSMATITEAKDSISKLAKKVDLDSSIQIHEALSTQLLSSEDDEAKKFDILATQILTMSDLIPPESLFSKEKVRVATEKIAAAIESTNSLAGDIYDQMTAAQQRDDTVKNAMAKIDQAYIKVGKSGPLNAFDAGNQEILNRLHGIEQTMRDIKVEADGHRAIRFLTTYQKYDFEPHFHSHRAAVEQAYQANLLISKLDTPQLQAAATEKYLTPINTFQKEISTKFRKNDGLKFSLGTVPFSLGNPAEIAASNALALSDLRTRESKTTRKSTREEEAKAIITKLNEYRAIIEPDASERAVGMFNKALSVMQSAFPDIAASIKPLVAPVAVADMKFDSKGELESKLKPIDIAAESVDLKDAPHTADSPRPSLLDVSEEGLAERKPEPTVADLKLARTLFAQTPQIEALIQATKDLTGSSHKELSSSALTYLDAKAIDFEKSVGRVESVASLEIDYGHVTDLFKDVATERLMLQDQLTRLQFLENTLVPTNYIAEAQSIYDNFRKPPTPALDELTEHLVNRIGDKAASKHISAFTNTIIEIPAALKAVKDRLLKIEEVQARLDNVTAKYKDAKQYRESHKDEVTFQGQSHGGLKVDVQTISYTTAADLDAKITLGTTPSDKTKDALVLARSAQATPGSTATFDTSANKKEVVVLTIPTATTFGSQDARSKDFTRIIAGNLPDKVDPDGTVQSVKPEVKVDHLRKDLDRNEIFLKAFDSLDHQQKNILKIPRTEVKTFFESYTELPVTKSGLKTFLKEHATFDLFGARSASSIADKFCDFYNKQIKDPTNSKCARSELIDICKISHDQWLSDTKGKITVSITGDSPEAKWTLKCYCEAMKLILKNEEMGGYTAKNYNYIDLEDHKKPDPNSREVRDLKDYLIKKYFPEKHYGLTDPASSRAMELYQTPKGRDKLETEIKQEIASIAQHRVGIEENMEKGQIKALRGGVVHSPSSSPTASISPSSPSSTRSSSHSESPVNDDSKSPTQAQAKRH